MRFNCFRTLLILCAFVCLPAVNVSSARAQSVPTASRGVIPSAFVGLTGTYTGLYGGRNLGITAGVDVGFKPYFGFVPAVELRGTYPINNGSIVGEEHVEGGLRMQKRFGGFRPYVDFLYGRGELNYQGGGIAVPQQAFRYLQTTSNVISPGIGLEIDVSPKVAVLLDGQAQIWHVPFDPSGKTASDGHLFSTPGTIGVVYRFGWLEHGHPGH